MFYTPSYAAHLDQFIVKVVTARGKQYSYRFYGRELAEQQAQSWARKRDTKVEIVVKAGTVLPIKSA